MVMHLIQAVEVMRDGQMVASLTRPMVVKNTFVVLLSDHEKQEVTKHYFDELKDAEDFLSEMESEGLGFLEFLREESFGEKLEDL